MNYTALLAAGIQLLSLPAAKAPAALLQNEVIFITDPVTLDSWVYGEAAAAPEIHGDYILQEMLWSQDQVNWMDSMIEDAGTWYFQALLQTEDAETLNYTGSYTILPKDASAFEVHAADGTVTISDGDTVLCEGTNYDIHVLDANTGLVRIEYKGNYTGTLEMIPEQEDPKEEIQTGWMEDEDGLKYVLEDGSYAAGWILINQDWYWFDENNVRYTGWLKDPNSGAWYWLDLDTGIMWHDAWLTDNGVKYYLGSTGSWIKDGWKKEGSNWKYVLGDGTCYNNGFQKINGLWYYFASDGIMKTGWIKDVDNKEYFMDRKDGWMHKNEWIDGKYYVDNCGVWQQTRWVQNANGKWWLRYPDGTYPHNGFLDVNNKTYYFDGEGWMVTGPVVDNNNTYYMLDSGEMAVNTTINGWYANSLGYAFAPEEAKIARYCDQVYSQVGHDLYKCYRWVIDAMSYQSLAIPLKPAGSLTYEQNYALYAFENHTGNCYCYAAMFTYLARGLGCQAEFVPGQAYLKNKGYWAEHGWCEIYEDGVWYRYDPDMEDANPTYNFFRLVPGQEPISYRHVNNYHQD